MKLRNVLIGVLCVLIVIVIWQLVGIFRMDHPLQYDMAWKLIEAQHAIQEHGQNSPVDYARMRAMWDAYSDKYGIPSRRPDIYLQAYRRFYSGSHGDSRGREYPLKESKNLFRDFVSR